jgi:hypothetical protein
MKEKNRESPESPFLLLLFSKRLTITYMRKRPG